MLAIEQARGSVKKKSFASQEQQKKGGWQILSIYKMISVEMSLGL